MGLAATIAAYLIWGLAPIYWKQLGGVPALELIMHRVLWSLVMLGLLIPLRGRSHDFVAVFRRDGEWRLLLPAAVLVFINWLTFVWVVNDGRIVEASFGYFLCPPVSILLGLVILRERLTGPEWAAVGFALAGVAVLVIEARALPFASIVIALSWGLYSLMKRRVKTGPITSLGAEMTLLAPIAAVYLGIAQFNGRASLGTVSLTTDLLLFGTGIFTATPLLLYAFGAQRIRLATIGLLQYLVPTGTLALAVFVYGEPFGGAQRIAFALIWTGLIIYSAAGIVGRRRARAAAAVAKAAAAR